MARNTLQIEGIQTMPLTCCRRIVLGEQQGFWEETKGQTSWWLVDASYTKDNT